MRVVLSQEGDFEFYDLEEMVAEFFLKLPSAVNLENYFVAEKRIFQEPKTNHVLHDDWKKWIKPELETLFTHADTVVVKDLKQLQDSPEKNTLRIPLQHTEAWINVLNRARLILEEKYKLSEEKDTIPSDNYSAEQNIARAQSELYGIMLQLLVDEGFC